MEGEKEIPLDNIVNSDTSCNLYYMASNPEGIAGVSLLPLLKFSAASS